jgi:hypothetical protein
LDARRAPCALLDNILEELARQAAIEIDLEDYARQYQLSSILDQFSKARSAGPKNGSAIFKAAEGAMRALMKSPFFKKGEGSEVLLSTEYYFTRLFLTYKREAWLDAYQHTARVLRISVPDGLLFHLFSCSLTLVRDEYGVFQPQEKFTLISQIIAALDDKIDLSQESRSAFLLLVKSALLRWRGRFERGPNQRSTYAQALRSCEKSFELSSNRGCLLQKALINYSSGLAFQLHEAPKHEPFFNTCSEIIDSPELADFPAAVKYRPRFYRETYRFRESIDAFWKGASRYPDEFKRVAFIIGEAASSEHTHQDQASVQDLTDAKSFLDMSLNEGYNHGRNVIAYIGCRGILEPDWFLPIRNIGRSIERELQD